MIQLLEKFYHFVQDTPDKTAIVDNGGERATSYKELDDMSGRVASWIIKQGIGREDVVAIRVPRGVHYVAVRLAAMKTGTAWVGVEDMMGEERISYIIKDSGAALVMDEENFEKAMQEEPLPADRWADPNLHDMAFIFYTSGSTGRPKGVVQEYGIYRNIVSSTYRSIDGYMPLNYANIAPETFIGGLYLMSGILSTGNTLHLIPLTLVRDPAGLLAYFKKHEIHATCMPPTLVKALESAGGMDLRVLHITGEIAVDLYIDRFPVMNAYGPTEFSYLPFFFDLDHAYKNTPIGTPDEDTRLVLLDEDGGVNPKEGALCMHLPYFRGYLHDEDRADLVDVDGVTYFRNGDYLSVDERGNYTLLGRIDDMVKINGNRIEPAEVEFAVRKVLDTDFAAVKVWERGGSRYLCAYHKTGRSLDAAEMAEKLKDMLPVYMIPSCYVSIDTIPLNENGKVDKKALPEPDESMLYASYAAPENDTQKKLCEVYAKVLNAGDHRIGIDDDFFLLGGDSLSAIRVVSEAGLSELTVTVIYRERTVRNIERALKEGMVSDDTAGDDRPYPMTDEQMYFLEQEIAMPGRVIYNLPIVLEFAPDTDEARLQDAMREVFLSHPALLTVIEKTKDGWRQQYRPENNVDVTVEAASEEEIDKASEEFAKPFTFDGKPLFRKRIMRSDKRLALFLDVHHIICDGYSLKIVVEDILSAMKGEKIPYDNYFALLGEQSGAVKAGVREKDREYFRNAYRGDFDRLPRPDLSGEVNKAECMECKVSFKTEEAHEAAKRLHISASAFYMLSSALALASYNDTQRVMLSWNYNGRADIRTMRAAGLLIRDYPVAFGIKEDDTVRSLAADLGRQLREAVMHGSVSPFMKRDDREMLCFLYQGDLLDAPEDDMLMGVDYPKREEQAAIEPLELNIYEDEEGTKVELNYDAGIYLPESIERFGKIYDAVCTLLISEKSGDTNAADIIRRSADKSR